MLRLSYEKRQKGCDEMYRVLIVDDELAAREMIACLVDWKEIGFEEPDMAKDGRQALELFRQKSYDIVFADIEMPFMDGLEMIEEMKREKSGQRFVIISCHESFAYARRALQMGVSEYFIKDLMQPEELYSCLLEHTAPPKSVFRGEQTLLVQERSDIFLRLLLGETVTEQDEELFAKNICSSDNKLYYSLGLAGIDEKEQKGAKPDHQMLCQTRRFYKRICQEGTAVIVPGERGILFLIPQTGNHSTAEKMNRTVEYINHIRNIARNCQIFSLTVGVSEDSDQIRDMEKLYEQAQKACNMKVFRGMNRTIFYNEISNNTWGLQGRALEECLEQMETLITEKDSRYQDVLKKLYRPNLYGGFLENNYLSYVNWRLWDILFYVRRKVRGKEKPRTDIMQQGVEQINRLDSAREMENFFTEIIQNDFLSEQKSKESGIVRQAKDYIESRLCEDISLSRIADALHVHKGYLCRVFREETGTNLVSYIRTRKVQEAKRMLEATALKIYEIAEALGYQSSQYFTMVFKKETGVSPNDYRKQLSEK